MSTAATVAGWVAAGVAMVVLLAARRTLDARMEAVARACHELRGPLTAVRLGLGLGSRASQGRGGGLSPARLRAIDTELGRASLALDDLAFLSLSVSARPGVPRLRALERVDVGLLVEDAVQVWQAAASSAGRVLRLRWEAPPAGVWVWGDRLRLAQAVGNLIANAVEHGGQDISVRGCVAGGRVRVEVADDGPGLPAPVRELARRARHGRGARGRGLAIAMAVAAAHGGRVAAAPCGRGARLVLELPAAGAAGVAAGPPRGE